MQDTKQHVPEARRGEAGLSSTTGRGVGDKRGAGGWVGGEEEVARDSFDELGCGENGLPSLIATLKKKALVLPCSATVTEYHRLGNDEELGLPHYSVGRLFFFLS